MIPSLAATPITHVFFKSLACEVIIASPSARPNCCLGVQHHRFSDMCKTTRAAFLCRQAVSCLPDVVRKRSCSTTVTHREGQVALFYSTQVSAGVRIFQTAPASSLFCLRTPFRFENGAVTTLLLTLFNGMALAPPGDTWCSFCGFFLGSQFLCLFSFFISYELITHARKQSKKVAPSSHPACRSLSLVVRGQNSCFYVYCSFFFRSSVSAPCRSGAGSDA